MRTIQQTIYRFSELPTRLAKDHAIYNYKAATGYNSADEAYTSLSKLAAHFRGKILDYEIDFFACSHSRITFIMPDLDEETIREQLEALGTYDPETLKGHGDCVLTGVCHDEDAIDGFRKAWFTGERDLEKLMQAAFTTWLESCQADCESFYQDKQFAEHADANNHEYTADGNAYRG